MTASTHHDHELDVVEIAAVARGDKLALGNLYDRHAPTLMALGMRLLGERSETEDVLHDVFVEVWKHAGDFDPQRASVRTWIILRMRSRCLDRLRAAPRARWTALHGRVEEALARARPGAAAALAAFDERVDAGRLPRLLAELPEEQRLVIVLGFFDGLSSSEIAHELGIPIGTVKSRVRSAMNKMRQAVGVERE
jgi:RNA polymerase sigma-70 factor (ECF subfamily)